MGHVFSLILNRELSDTESADLLNSGCRGATLVKDSLPTNADIAVSRLDFDDTLSPTLAEAIESALEAVGKVPDLTVPGLTVPAVPSEEEPTVVAGEVVENADAAEVKVGAHSG